MLVDAAEGPSVRAERLRLAALDATATAGSASRLPVPADRVTSKHPPGDHPRRRCCGCTPRWPSASPPGAAGCWARRALDGELAALRAELDRLGPGTAAARAAAGELALRAASALMTAAGSRSLLVTEHGQRLAREAMFTLVYALRPGSRSALLARLGAPELG